MLGGVPWGEEPWGGPASFPALAASMSLEKNAIKPKTQTDHENSK